jgi:hypothetical protein
MRKTIEVAFATIILALCLTKAAGAPLEGTWEGKINGQKAMTLKITGVAGHLEGSVIMCVVDTKFGDPEAHTVGQEQRTLADVKWDDKTLRFSIRDPDAYFEMTVTGSNSAVLKRLAGSHAPELTLQLQRQ